LGRAEAAWAVDRVRRRSTEGLLQRGLCKRCPYAQGSILTFWSKTELREARFSDLHSAEQIGGYRKSEIHRFAAAHRLPERLSSSVQEKDRDCGDNAQRDENEQRDPHANREAVGKRGLTGWDSHEPREPVIELHICRLIRSFVALDRLSVAFPASPPAECAKHSCRLGTSPP
jgi:hypothetical protein